MSGLAKWVMDERVQGYVFVGRYERVESRPSTSGGRDFSQVVVSLARYDGTRFERSFIFDDYDFETGAQTDASVGFRALVPGDMVAVRLISAVSKSGKVWYKATMAWALAPFLDSVKGGAPPAALASVGANGKSAS